MAIQLFYLQRCDSAILAASSSFPSLLFHSPPSPVRELASCARLSRAIARPSRPHEIIYTEQQIFDSHNEMDFSTAVK